MRLMLGDCIERIAEIEAGSVDLVLTDPPYGTTACKWDAVIPFEPMWALVKRVLKPNGAAVFTASQPFTSALVMSNPGQFKYQWVWDKVNKYTGALNANKMPLRRHEDVLVFCAASPAYNKQWRDGKPFKSVNTNGHGKYTKYGTGAERRHTINDGRHNPCSVLQIPADNKKELGLHPTQKPVALMEYLIRTYTDEGETVLDFTMGSGTTGVACLNTGRRFIGIERDEKYFQIAQDRIAAT